MSRRHLLSSIVVTLAVVVPALGDELHGRLTKVHVDEKKLTVVERGTNKEVDVTINSKTEWVTPKKTRRPDLGKLKEALEKRAKKGVMIAITHEKGVASNVELERKKKQRNRSVPWLAQ